MEGKICPCGNLFVPTNNRQKRCSRLCWHRAWREAKGIPKQGTVRLCPCGKEFVPSNNCQRFCERKCGDSILRAKRLGVCPIWQKRDCIVCKKEFLPKTLRQTFCSHRCSSSYWTQTHRDRYNFLARASYHRRYANDPEPFRRHSERMRKVLSEYYRNYGCKYRKKNHSKLTQYLREYRRNRKWQEFLLTILSLKAKEFPA